MVPQHLEVLPYISPVADWLNAPANLHERIVQVEYGHTSLAHLHVHNNPPQSQRQSSSMTPTIIYNAPASTHTPSLTFSPTASTTSVFTPLSYQDTFPTSHAPLEETHGVLTLIPQHPCVFWFLNCTYTSTSRSEWATHCTSHFRSAPPPSSVTCPLCAWATEGAEGAWARSLDHIADEHFARGQSFRAYAVRPRVDLVLYLWRRRVIADQQLQELRRGVVTERYVVTGGREGERGGGGRTRRERRAVRG
ncbi:hypothetical protein C7974DRAFT_400961 [Boeremia exigua]|uniref:uncharacterized protein n=1 Tax=Boeremia exigua TaxID=749465 RepID=UPI001E8E9728|nr:uncharacterized protein C7974DRAFT_400961 [Boeremia exigua]KAH6618819.1 hypothetical protein C7974DRAFT_400961 [Boeremia exigua]